MAKLAQGAFVVYKLVNGDSIFATYHDNSLDNYPAAPVGDGTTNGWHRALTAKSKWRCEKVAQSELLGTWGEPAPIGGKDLFPTPILSLLPAHTAISKSSSGVYTPDKTSCRKVLQVNGQTEVIGVDPPIMYRGRNLAPNSRATVPWTGNKDKYQMNCWGKYGVDQYMKAGHTYTVLAELYVDEEFAKKGLGIGFYIDSSQDFRPYFKPTTPTIVKATITVKYSGALTAYHMNNGTPGNSYINWVVLVEGDVAPEDWIPAPEGSQITCNGAAYSDGTDVAIPTSATSLTWELTQYDKVIDKETVPIVSDGANGEAGKDGINGANGVNGKDGTPMVWKGTFESAPLNPQNGWSYYNNATKRSYTYQDGAWYQMTVDGANGANGTNGTDGLSIVWKGNMSIPPTNPQNNWAYRDDNNGRVYIYNGTAWALMVADGNNGSDGAKGDDGLSVFITYHDNPIASKPTKPTGTGTSDGWHTAPSTSCVWMSQKVSLSVSIGEWGDPIQIKGEAGKYPVQEYKASVSQPTGAGSKTPPAITKGQLLWMRIGEVVPPNTEPTTWSDYVRISGEKGEAGADGIKNPYRDYSFALSSQSTTKDPSTSPVIDGTWADIPPVVITDKYLWQRVSYYSVTAANEWTKTPVMSYVRLSGEDGRVGVNLINYHMNLENDMWGAWFASTAGEGEQVIVSAGVITGTSKGGSPASYNSIINRMDWLFVDYHKILSIGKQFTLSFIARGDNSVSEVRIGNPSGGSHVDIFAKSFNVGAEWQQHKITFSVSQEFTSGSMLLFRLGGAVATTMYQLQIKDVKLEPGDRATAWITSPNDADYPTKYLRNALKDGKAVINPDGIDGLMLGNVLGVVPPVNGEYSLRNMRAGMSGIADDGIAFFAHQTDAYNVARKYLNGESRVRPNYAVTDTGKLISNDADIEGRITATSGKIGSFDIDVQSGGMWLRSGDSMALSCAQLYFGDKSRDVFLGSHPSEGYSYPPILAHLKVLEDVPTEPWSQQYAIAMSLDAQTLNSIALNIKGKIRMNDMIAPTGYFDIGNGSINSGKYGTIRIYVTNGIITRLQAI